MNFDAARHADIRAEMGDYAVMTTERPGRKPRAASQPAQPLLAGNKAPTVYEELRSRIISGRFECDTWLRAEAIAEEFGVSRTPVREAFRQLHADGLVELIPNRGARVARITEDDLEATYELHALLEGYGARRAAECGTTDVAHLRELCTSMEQKLQENDTARYDAITLLNLEFHRFIHQASGNIALPGLIAGFAQHSLVRQTFAEYTPAEIDRAFAQHREMADAIEAGDGALSEAIMRSHVLAARATLRRKLAATEH